MLENWEKTFREAAKITETPTALLLRTNHCILLIMRLLDELEPKHESRHHITECHVNKTAQLCEKAHRQSAAERQLLS